jgi:hypothetical protein
MVGRIVMDDKGVIRGFPAAERYETLMVNIMKDPIVVYYPDQGVTKRLRATEAK